MYREEKKSKFGNWVALAICVTGLVCSGYTMTYYTMGYIVLGIIAFLSICMSD